MVSTVSEPITISDRDSDSEIPMTCLDSFLRNRPREGGEKEGNGEEAGEETEDQERFAK